MKRLFMFMLIAMTAITFMSCEDSVVASRNVSRAAHQFEIYRRVVFLNGITDSYILQVEGYCSVVNEGAQLAVIIKTDSGEYLKHYLGLSDNVTYFSEQLEAAKVSDKHYRVIFKPSVIVPNIDLE